jgi:formylglycine-generating enzyme required for sulfatase activity
MVLVPAGEFAMGDTFSEGDSSELPIHIVYISPYYIGTHEVTNEQYADALNWAYTQGGLIAVNGGVVYQAGSGTDYPYCNTDGYDSGSCVVWDGSTFSVESGRESQPVVHVSWYGAAAYCNWRSAMVGKPLCYDLSTWACNFGVAGYRLPTEAEWEKAARGGVAGHRFPWSDTDNIQHARANYNSRWEGGAPYYSYDTSPTEGTHPDFTTGVYPYTSPVGYFDPNDYGLYDMAGNVFEWCNDWYDSSYYDSSPYDDPTGPASGSYRTMRGGSWINWPPSSRCAHRSHPLPDARMYHYGFRFALNAE